MKDNSIVINPPEELKDPGSILEYAIMALRSMIWSDDRFPSKGEKFALGDVEVLNLASAAAFVECGQNNFHYHLRTYEKRSGKTIPRVKTADGQKGTLFVKKDLIPLRLYLMAKNGKLEIPESR